MLVSIMTRGPSSLTVRTTTTGGASPSTPSRLATTLTSTTLVRFVPMMTSGLRTATPMVQVPKMLTATPLPKTLQPATLRTSTLLPLARDKNTGVVNRTTGMHGVAIKTSMRRFLTMTPMPSLTPLSLTMSGTTVTLTNGALKLGVKITTSMVLLLTARRLLL